jgi:hypothetical protein
MVQRAGATRRFLTVEWHRRQTFPHRFCRGRPAVGRPGGRLSWHWSRCRRATIGRGRIRPRTRPIDSSGGERVIDGSGKRVADRLTACGRQEGCPPGEPLHDARATDPDDRPGGLGRAVAELTLLLPYQQLEALESAATEQEMTVGQLLRRLIRDGLAEMDDAPGARSPRPPGRRSRREQRRLCLERRRRRPLGTG